MKSSPTRATLRLAQILWLLLLAILPGGCDRSDPDREILAPIQAQIKALNRRDAAGAIAPMHPDAAGLAQARRMTEELTATYDLVYMIQSLTIVSKEKNEARVRFVQMTERVSGPEFRRNRVTGVHTLRKYQNSWRIFSTKMESVEYPQK